MVWRAPRGHIPVSNPARLAFREPPSSLPSLHLLDQTNRFPSDHRCTPSMTKEAGVCIHSLNGLGRGVQEKV